MIDSDLLNENECASYLKITTRTLRRWRKSKGVPHMKISAKTICYYKTSVDQWLAKKRVAITA